MTQYVSKKYFSTQDVVKTKNFEKNFISDKRGKNIFSAFFLPYIIYGLLRKDLETDGENSEKQGGAKKK